MLPDCSANAETPAEKDSSLPAPALMRGVLSLAIKQGLAAYWDLAKVIIPVYFAVALLSYAGIVAVFAKGLAPAMGFFGLPGEAAVVLLTGWLLSLYAALGALKALALPSSAVTAVGLMLLICHALPMEWAVFQKMGARAGRVSLMRFLVSLLAGAGYALLCGKESLAAAAPMPAAVATGAGSFPIFLAGSLLGCAKLLALVLAIILPITVISEWARGREFLPRAARRLSLALRQYGPGEGTLLPLLIGLIFGVVYGGGAMIALSRTGAVRPSEARTVALFLGLCHSLIEDSLLLIALGGHWFWLVVVRFMLAILLTPILRRWA